MEKLQIQHMADVRCFFYYLIVEMGIGAGFHPDTPIDEYVGADNYPIFQHGGGTLQKQLNQCFDVCNQLKHDIYEEGLKIAQALGFAPQPDEFGEELVLEEARLSPLTLKAGLTHVFMRWDGLKFEINKACWPMVRAFCDHHFKD